MNEYSLKILGQEKKGQKICHEEILGMNLSFLWINVFRFIIKYRSDATKSLLNSSIDRSRSLEDCVLMFLPGLYFSY